MAHGFTSKVSSVYLNITSSYELGNGVLDVDFRHSYNDQEVPDVDPSTINAGRVFDLENQVPNHKTVLSFTFDQGALSTLVRLNRYGGWSSTGGLFGPGDASDAADYDSAVLVDAELSFSFGENYTLSVGGENIFDKYPDDEANGVLQFLGQQYAITSPFGFNGAFWYVRASASF
jgi:iron complex outermembrane receptor protein